MGNTTPKVHLHSTVTVLEVAHLRLKSSHQTGVHPVDWLTLKIGAAKFEMAFFIVTTRQLMNTKTIDSLGNSVEHVFRHDRHHYKCASLYEK